MPNQSCSVCNSNQPIMVWFKDRDKFICFPCLDKCPEESKAVAKQAMKLKTVKQLAHMRHRNQSIF